MFSEDFLEMIRKTENAYKAQNVSEIVRRSGRAETIVILPLAACMVVSAAMAFEFLDSFLNTVFSAGFAALAVALALYLQKAAEK